MSESISKNPLLGTQREISGASTFEKYLYQYHWALFRALKEYEDGNQFVIFVEFHEDVVVSDSLDSSLAKFEFNQIKNVSGSPWTSKAITKRKKSGEKEKNSILGKMLQGVEGKPFKDKVDQLNLVATCGFNLKLKDASLNYELIKVGHLHDDCVKEIEDAIFKELNQSNLPANLCFIKPELHATGFNHHVVSRISEIIDKKNPNTFSNVQNIYRVLIDGLTKKGVVTYDYENWEDLVNKKGLTNFDIDNVTQANCKSYDHSGIEKLFDDISNELGLHTGKKTKLKRAYQSYENRSRFTKTTVQLELSEYFKKLVTVHKEAFDEYGIKKFLEVVLMQIEPSIKAHFQDDISLEGAIIYELIVSAI